MVLTTFGLASKEQGRELKAMELKAGQIVVIQPVVPPHLKDRIGRMVSLTMNVLHVDTQNSMVTFDAPVMRMTVLNFFDDAGNIFDDRGDPVHVYEYLGEP